MSELQDAERPNIHDKLGFDPDQLRQKYREERDRRVRVDGNDQYVEVKGDFAHYVDDPYIEQPIEREPLNDEVEVIIIGGGFGGLIAAARLREIGVSDLRIIEKGGDFGGTWYWNRYPGAQCDIESYIYLPLLEEVGYVPKEKYTYAPEILSHASALGKHYNLYPQTCFQTEVSALAWQESEQRWLVHTNRGDVMRASYVIMSNGPLNRPKLPGIPGIDQFQGHSFHTSRWDYDYTGGDSTGNLHKLNDKRVGIIGTGATAVQCVPHVGKPPLNSFLSFNVRQVPLTNVATDPPTRNGRKVCSPAGKKPAWKTSTPWCREGLQTRIWSTTAGPTSFATCCF